MIFTSRVTGTARDLGLTIKPARSVDILEQLAAQQTPRCIIVDLGNSGLKLGELMAFLHTTCSPVPRVVAYGSHVDAESLRLAREAGCDPVLPRSKFVEELPRALRGWAS